MKKSVIFSIILIILCLSGCKKSDPVSQPIVNEPVQEAVVETSTTDNTEIVVSNEIEIEVSEEEDSTNESAESEEATEETPEESEEIVTGNNAGKRVVCFGDSLTEGTGGNGVTMPNTLEKISGATVLNYGVYAEETSCISARQGANPQYTIEDVTIPADTTPVPVKLKGNYGPEMLLVFGNAGVNNCQLAGVEGKYFLNENDDRCFARLTPGEAVFVPAGTQLFTHAMLDKRADDITVIWAGGNDTPQNVDEITPVLKKIDEMIAFTGSDKYIVISDMNRHSRIPVTDEFNAAFAEHYGKHFLNLRSYLINNALKDKGLTPTQDDLEDINKGEIPDQLRTDDVHGTSLYYQIAGEQVYKKLRELGYLE